MPWKIHTVEMMGRQPFTHMEDASVNLHLVTHLTKGVINLYIGHLDADKARLHVEFRTHLTPIARLLRASDDFQHQDLVIIDSVLQTMGLDHHQRSYILPRRLWDRCDRDREQLK